MFNASELLFHNIDVGRGANIAIYHNDKAITYAQLAENANRAGSLFQSLNIPQKSLIIILMNDKPEYAAAFFGGLKAGYVMVPLNTTFQSEDYKQILNNNQAQAIVVDSILYSKISGIKDQCPNLKHVIVVGPEIDSTLNYDKLLLKSSSKLTPVQTLSDDMAIVMYSSGSTGTPKGTVHLHKDMQYIAQTTGKHVYNIQPNDIIFSISKLYFAFGLGNSFTFPFSVGASAILLSGWGTPENVFDHIEKYKPTIFCSVPSFYLTLLHTPNAKNRDLHSLRLCISSSEKMPSTVYEEWYKTFGLEIIEGIGSTEMLHIFIANRPGKVNIRSIGQIIPGYDAKIVNEEGKEVGPNEIGVMMVKGGSSAPYYLNNPEKSKETMRGEWIYTNDQFHKDDEGYFYYDGRADDMYKIAGQWVSPIEVEHILLTIPAIKDCVVTVTKDNLDNIKSKALLILNSSESIAKDQVLKEIKQHLKSRLPPYKHPQEYEFVENFPMTSTGKKKRSFYTQ